MINYLKAVLRGNLGGWAHRRAHRALVRKLPGVSSSLQNFRHRWPETEQTPSPESPIFLLASSWRAGSTALQRMVCSAEDTLIWGEPWRDCNLVQRLATSLCSISHSHPTDKELSLLGQPRSLSDQWIATLSPHPGALKAAHKALIEALLRSPAVAQGYVRWGLKEVRLGHEHIEYLRWLYPKARFVLIHRNPYEAYRSYRFFETWYRTWPSEPILSARDFGLHWRRLTDDFIAASDSDHCLLISHQELTDTPAETAAAVAQHLDISIPKGSALERITGRGKVHTGPPSPVPGPELRALRRVVDKTAGTLGYVPPQRSR